MIIGELHHEMMVMWSPHYIVSPHEPNECLDVDSFFEYSQSGLGMYDYDEVCSKPVNFSNDIFSFQFGYHDPIGIWLEKPFLERYPLHSILHILYYVNGMVDDLILSIFNGFEL